MDRLANAPKDSHFDITLQVIREVERDHPGQATKVLCRDSEGTLADLQVFRNSPVKDTAWETDTWYRFEHLSLYSRDDRVILRAIGATSVTSVGLEVGDELEGVQAETTTTETTLLHLSDTHLGHKPYGSEARANDFVEAFVEAIDIGIQRDVDAIVHTGDVTHHDDPDAGLDQRAWDELERLSDHEIPFLLIVGNHDLTADGTPQPWLQTAVEQGLCRRLGTEPVVIGDIALYGIDYHDPSWWQNRTSLELATPPERTRPFLCLHQSISPLAPGNDRVRLADVLGKTDPDLEAVLLGHSHYTQAATIENVVTFYAGSTERTTRGYRDEPTVVTELKVGTDIDLTTHSLDTRQFSTYTVVNYDDHHDTLSEECRHIDPDGEVVTAFVVGGGPDCRTVERAFEAAGALDARCYEATVDPGFEPGIYAGDPETLATAEQSL